MTINANTKFITIATGEYPVTLHAIKQRHRTLSIGTGADAAFFKGLGYGVVTPTSRPAGDVVTEGSPQVTDDGYVQTWNAREFNEQEIAANFAIKKMEAKRKVDALLANTLEKGAGFEFDGIEGELHVQMRSDDRTNISGLKQAAEYAISLGAEDKVFTLRTWEDVNVDIMAVDMVKLAWAYLDAYSSIMARSWALKDLITAAESEEELPAIPEVL